MSPEEDFIQLEGVKLHALFWQPEDQIPGSPTFVLLHGLSSNARTWEMVADFLVEAGYPVVAVNQRGHGLSEKPDRGYDFATITRDLHQLVKHLGTSDIILAGQSWGGNVVLEAAARYPNIARGLVFVDGGFLDLGSRGSWEDISQDLRPPALVGLSRDAVALQISQAFPGWVPRGVEMTLGNFEHLQDGTVRPWLTLDNHMVILRALYDQHVLELFPKINVPVLICPAADGSEWTPSKRTQVDVAVERIPDTEVHWFADTAHDIHVDQPEKLARLMLKFAGNL
jgi:pimeloyl-ACP methyl ester carboxylesterase